MWVILRSPAAGGTENGEDDSKKATEEELSFVKSSICEQWKKLGVCIHTKNSCETQALVRLFIIVEAQAFQAQ